MLRPAERARVYGLLAVQLVPFRRNLSPLRRIETCHQLSNRHQCLPSQHTRTIGIVITSTHLSSNHPKRRPTHRGLHPAKSYSIHSCAAAWETLKAHRVIIMRLRSLLALALMGQRHLAGVLAATDDIKVDLRPCLITKAAIVSACLFVRFSLSSVVSERVRVACACCHRHYRLPLSAGPGSAEPAQHNPFWCGISPTRFRPKHHSTLS